MIRPSVTPDAQQRVPSLDGLRGVAALAVVWLHCQGALFARLGVPSHAYLAVDFFFCLSGFVITRAYDRRFAAGMTAGEFVGARVRRLYPMLVLGVLLGAAPFLATIGGSGLIATVIATAATLALMPVGLLYGRGAFFIDGPMWSLFFEIAANLAYAAAHRITRRALMAFAGASAAAMLALTMINGDMSEMGFQTPSSFLMGFVRVAYPFAAGMILGRMRGRTAPSIHPLVPYVVLVAMLFMPVGRNWLYDLVATFLVVPAIVAASVATDQAGQPRILRWLGAISYPLYLLHEPIMRLAVLAGLSHAAGRLGEPAIVAIVMVAAVTMATLAERFYEVPVRRLLARHRGRSVAIGGVGRDGVAIGHLLG